MTRLFALILVFGLTLFAVIGEPVAHANSAVAGSDERVDNVHPANSKNSPMRTFGNTTVTFQDGVSGYTGTRDTYTYQVSPATVRGAENLIIQDRNPSSIPEDERTSLLQFDLSAIPANSTIVSAQLDFYVDSEGQGFNMYRMKVPWNEATASYTSIGNRHFIPEGIDAEIAVSAFWSGVDGYVGPITVSVPPSQISDWVNGVMVNNGWLMTSAHFDDGVQLRSSEHATIANRPKLTVVYNETPPNFAPASPVVISPPDNATDISTSPNLEVSVADPNVDNLTVTYYGRPVTPPSTGEDFTIIAMPDTQHYVDNGGANAANFYAQTQWIVANKDALNIRFVTGLGDISENGNTFDSEWQIANTAYTTIEDPVTTNLVDGIPYGLAVGNHDQSPNGGGDTASTTKYNQYFGTSRFSGRGYYGGQHGTNNDNHYELFSGGGMDFIIIHLEYDTTPLPEVLTWADGLLQTYSDRRAIVTTHWMVGMGHPAPFSAQGAAIYNELKDRPNLFMQLGGHVHAEGRRQDTFQGRTVWSLLSDYQARPNGGNGLLRIMTFSPANNTISVKTYSPSLAQFETDFDSQFTLSYDMSGSAPFQLIGTNNSVPSGTNTSINWPGLTGGIEYEWYATTSDGIETTTSPIWSFITTFAGPTPTFTATATATFTPTPTNTPTSTATATPTSTPVSGIDHVVWIWFENKEANQITAASAPFFANFAANGVNFTEFYGMTHPSQPNYLHAFAGSNLGVTTNNYCTFPVGNDSLPQQLAAAGRSWRVYAQNYPGACSDVVTASGPVDGWGAAGNYDRKHNPAIPFEGTRLNPAECSNIQPLANFDPLVNFSFVVPNNINSMHDGTIAQGDAFLQAFMPQVTNSPDWARTLVIVSFDEGTSAINGGGRIYTAARAPWITPGGSSSTFYNHHSALRTIEDIFGLPYLGGAATSTTITEVFPPAATNTPTFSPTSTATDTPTNTPTPPAVITGTATYGNAIGAPNPRFVSNVAISGVGSPNVSATTDFPSGSYSLTGFGSGSYTVTPSKANGHDASVSSFDAARIAQYVSSLTTFSPAQQTVADVSGNGGVSSFDAALVASFAVGNDGGSSGSWRFSPLSRTYPSITTDILGEDYSALLMGEVSGNWTNTGARPAGKVNNEQWTVDSKDIEPESGILVELPNAVSAIDKEIVVPVNVHGIMDKGVIAYEFDLRYDPAVIQPLPNVADVAGTVSRGLSVVVNSSEPGLLRVAVYGAMPIEENGLLVNLRFTAVGASGSVSPISFERIVFNEGLSRVTIADGKIELF
ncbi:MAG: DNRLRE domain-containing protein [Chloracidobacterium sp.]|nr:DNRLRE domain-containing protein [Chloracidobacterium sp.]